MFVPLPGLSHLKVLHFSPVPAPEITPEAAPKARQETLQSTATQLTVIALETAFGIRPTQHLSRKRYAVGVRAHVTARQHRAGPRGPVRLDSLHLRTPDPETVEIFGSATVAQHPHGFTASLEKVGREQWRMRTFRVIEAG